PLFRPRVLIAASIACIVAAIAIEVQIASFLRNSAVHGAALIHRERQAIAAAAGHGSHCRAPADLGGPRGLLEAPALGLVAPVAEGISDAVLNDAVGHVPASAWPGRWGTSVFAAHDVTRVARIAGLARAETPPPRP